jgi:sugar phosphate isomerase/epimerase
VINLKLSIIDTLCPRDNLLEKLELLEEIGIEGIELEAALSGAPKDKMKSVHEALSSSSVKLSTVLIGYQGGLLAENRDVREKTLEEIKRYMEVCARLGGIGVVTVPSSRRRRHLFGISVRRNKDFKQALAIEQYRILGKYASDLGVYVIIEPVDHLQTDFVNTCDQAVEICKMTRADMIKICPDFFHMSIEHEDIGEKIHEFSSYIAHLHIGDCDNKSRFAVLPGRGNLNLYGAFEALKAINYSNYSSLDCKIPDEKELRWSVHFLEETFLKNNRF